MVANDFIGETQNTSIKVCSYYSGKINLGVLVNFRNEDITIEMDVYIQTKHLT